jgi:hypothetical protein
MEELGARATLLRKSKSEGIFAGSPRARGAPRPSVSARTSRTASLHRNGAWRRALGAENGVKVQGTVAWRATTL